MSSRTRVQTERRHGHGRNADRGKDGDVNCGGAKDEARPLIGEAALVTRNRYLAVNTGFESHYCGSWRTTIL
jgi:hypothetical protein